MNVGRRAWAAAGGVVAVALGAGGMYLLGGEGSPVGNHAPLVKDPPSGLRLERTDRAFPLAGVVTADGGPLGDAQVTVGEETVYTDETGMFSFGYVPLGVVTVTRPGYRPVEYTFDGSLESVEIPMDHRIVRAIHISSSWSVNDAEMSRLIDLAGVTTVNAFVFDAMGDDGYIDYNTQVQAAIDHRMIADEPYDVAARLQQAKDAGLYTIVRISVFANPQAVKAFPSLALGGGFLDPAKPEAWEYPLALATEACNLGFDEINFDYIRYPSTFFKNTPQTQEGRTANIGAYLDEARARLHALGCAVSANSFGGPTMVTTDYGIGQRIEDFTAHIDAYSPMTYPDLWKSPGYFGFKDPWNHPKEVVAGQLDSAMPRMDDAAVMRPWLQASWYPDSWILVQIEVAETRGLGWMIWNAYDDPMRTSSFPAGTTGEG